MISSSSNDGDGGDDDDLEVREKIADFVKE